MNFGKDEIFLADEWKIIEDKFQGGKNEVSESVFSLANGYMGVRGNFEEDLEKNSLQGSYIAGIYNREDIIDNWKRIGFPEYENQIANTTNWLKILISIDGEAFNIERSQYSDYLRELHMDKGILNRTLNFTTESGCRTSLSWERIVNRADQHIGTIRMIVKALNHNKEIKLSFELDGVKENSHKGKRLKHTTALQCTAEKSDMYLLKRIDTSGQYFIHRMFIHTPDIKIENETYQTDSNIVRYVFSFFPKKNTDYAFDKIVSIWCSRDAGYPFGLLAKGESLEDLKKEQEDEVCNFLIRESKQNLTIYEKDNAYDALKINHIKKIKEIWENNDIHIEGDLNSQQGLRYCIFQLATTYTGFDEFLTFGPKGYSGEAHWGRTYWDNESYCIPFYVLTNPEAALKLLEYRYNTLDKARERAKLLDYDGAMYPWTTIDGTEDTAYWEYWMGGIHINAIIPYSIYLYTKTTGNSDFVYSKGIEVLIETARFWASRCVYVPYRKAYVLNKVNGPDEYALLVDNNYYTNYMAKWTLEYVLQIIGELKEKSSEDYAAVCQKLDFDEHEMNKWKEITKKMLLLEDKEIGVFIQNDNFFNMEPYSRETFKKDKVSPDVRWPIEKTLRMDVVKQPDVLLLFYLFRDKFTLEEKKNNFRFYEQRTIHGSSLSPSIHSIIGQEIGRNNLAFNYYLWASRLDLDDYNGNTHEGLHISSQAGTWLSIVYGFGGLTVGDKELFLKPVLPGTWKSYSFRFTYRGSVIEIAVSYNNVNCRLIKGENIELTVHGTKILCSGEIQIVSLPEEVINKVICKGIVFDLDGVITDTARFHYKAWKKIADQEGIFFDEEINERLKGVSRMASLKVIMERKNKEYTPDQLQNLAEEKNNYYKELLDNLTPEDILPGIMDFIANLKKNKIKTSVCSASKNTDFILEKLGISHVFDAIVTGNDVKKSKPDPEGMIIAAQRMGLKPEECTVVEDAYAGIQAAVKAGMKSLGIGDRMLLHNADYVIPETKYINMEKIELLF